MRVDDSGLLAFQATTFLAVFQDSVASNLSSTPSRGTPVQLRGVTRPVFDLLFQAARSSPLVRTRRVAPNFERPYQSARAPRDLDLYYSSERISVRKELIIGEGPSFLDFFQIQEVSASCCGPAKQLREGSFDWLTE